MPTPPRRQRATRRPSVGDEQLGQLHLPRQPAELAGRLRVLLPTVMVLASGVLAALGVVGLVWLSKPWRAPLVVTACLGLFCITVGHRPGSRVPSRQASTTCWTADFALLRNVSKADLMLRLPLCLGIGAVYTRLGALPRRLHVRKRRVPTGILVTALVALLLGLAQPAVAMKLRTPGWRTMPDYWSQVADYLDKAPGEKRAWVVPGTGFGLQTWGWTMDEPFQAVAKTPWVSRSQVPLTPPQTIRTLSSLERFLDSGSGSPNLGPALGRLGIGYVLLRHDLDEQASETTSNLVAIALARSRGIERVATFGAVDLGPAIELYRVTSSDVAPELEVRAPRRRCHRRECFLRRRERGDRGTRVSPPTSGRAGRRRMGSPRGRRRRHLPRSGTQLRSCPLRRGTGQGPGGALLRQPGGARLPGNEASRPVRAQFEDGAFATASSSQGWTHGLGRVEPQSAPYAAVDDDLATGWRSAFFQRPEDQWWRRGGPSSHEIGRVRIRTPVGDGESADVKPVAGHGGWEIRQGQGRPVPRHCHRRPARRPLRSPSHRRRRHQTGTMGQAVSVLEVTSDVTPYQRTLALPAVTVARPNRASSSPRNRRRGPASPPCSAPTAPRTARTRPRRASASTARSMSSTLGHVDAQRHGDGSLDPGNGLTAEPAGQPRGPALVVAVALGPGALGASGLRRGDDHVVDRRPSRRRRRP